MPIPFIRIEIAIDADQRNADWIKTRSWDFPVLPKTEEELDEFIAQYFPNVTPEQFRTLPVYEGWRYTLSQLKADSEQQSQDES
ncbi:MAG: hypothetical protein Kow00106_06070 [Anaerolineae bacterium]